MMLTARSKKMIRNTALVFLLFLMGLFCNSHISYASQSVALLVNGLKNSRAGQNGIKCMEKVIGYNEEWENCNINYYSYDGENPLNDTTEEKLTKAIKNTFSNCTEKTAIFYYVGHGTFSVNDGDGFQLHGKKEKRDIKVGKYKYRTLLQVLSNITCKKLIIILDCCGSGNFISMFKNDASEHLKNKTTIITSASPDQMANFIESKKGNNDYFLFSKVLSLGLTPKIGIISADSNRDGRVIRSEFIKYINGNMASYKMKGLKGQKTEQTAQCYVERKLGAIFSYSLKTGSSKKSIYEGRGFSISAKLFGIRIPSDAIKCTKSTDGIVSVKKDGLVLLVTGKKPGKVKLTLKYDKLKSTVEITVKKIRISLNKTSVSLKAGNSKTLKATVVGPSDRVRWTSSDKTVATVSKSGKITGKAAGNAVITASANGKKAICKVTVTGGKKVVYAQCKLKATAVILEDGSLWVCGFNYGGKLGIGKAQYETESVNVFTKVSDNVCKVDLGYDLMAFIKNDGSLWMCGSGFGWVDNEITRNTGASYVPVKVMEQVSDIAVGDGYTLILKSDGSLWGCGSDSHCNLLGKGIEDYGKPVKLLDHVKSVKANHWTCGVLKDDNTCWFFGKIHDYDHGLTMVPVNNVKTFDVHDYYISVVSNDGKAHTFQNSNELDQTIVIADSAKQMIVTSTDYMGYGNPGILLKRDGTVWVRGFNYHGYLGTGKEESSTESSFTKVMSGVKSVSTDGTTTAFLKENGTLYMCGETGMGQLGNRDLEDYQLTPIQISF